MRGVLAACLERLVEGHGSLRQRPVEREGKEDLRRHARKHQPRRVAESEFRIVPRMADKATPLGLLAFSRESPSRISALPIPWRWNSGSTETGPRPYQFPVPSDRVTGEKAI